VRAASSVPRSRYAALDRSEGGPARVTSSPLLCGQFKAGERFHLTEKYRWLHLKRTADVEDAAERRVGLSQFDEADEGTLIAGLCGQSLLAHLLP
jgi:hypothetical protein